MKINEAIEAINATNSVRAQEDLGTLYIFMRSANPDDWFIEVGLKEFGWAGVEKDFDTCLDDDISARDLARVMDVVQRLAETPVSERFPEKKYRLYVMRNAVGPIPDKCYLGNYGRSATDEHFDYVRQKDAWILSENQIKNIRSYTPLIDAFKKEEVKDDETN